MMTIMAGHEARSVDVDDRDTRLARVLATHGRAIERVAASFARSRAERADLLQEIALSVHLALDSFRGEASERTFVLRIAHNRAVTFAARRGTPPVDLDEHADQATASSGSNPMVRYGLL
jgi:DNA-directed RNA polymerase specialized sigma24 family protein